MTATQSYQPCSIDVLVALRICIDACNDGERAFAVAAADVVSEELKQTFRARREERANFVLALEHAVQSLGGLRLMKRPDVSGTHRGWATVRELAGDRTDTAIAEECERSERLALGAYQSAFGRTPLDALPVDLCALLKLQYAAIQMSVNHLGSLSK